MTPSAWPIRVRITLGSLLVAGIVLAGVAGLMAFQIRSTTNQSETTLANSDIAPYIADLRNNPGEKPDTPSSGILVAIRAESGAFLLNTLPTGLQRNLDDRDLHDRDFVRLPGAASDAQAPTRRVSSGGTTYVVVERHLATSHGDYTLWGARSTASGDLTIAALDRSLALGLVLALAGFGAAAWLLTTLSLRPVRRMAQSAERLSRDDTGQSLPVPPGRDELATLGRTLNAFIDRLRRSADHERQMVSDASHELRTPLAALTARLERAHRSAGDAAALEREIDAAQTSVARLTELTTVLLELSRLDAPGEASTVGTRAQEQAETAPPESLVAELLESVDRARVSDGHGSVTIDFEVPDSTDDGMRYDIAPAAFGRIADNLLSNAVTFSPEQGTVTVVLDQRDDGALHLVVRDEGPGVPGDFLPIAFDRFTRADESRRRIRGGSGLGLALVRGLAVRAGGEARLANAAGGGAEAIVILPATTSNNM
ncbi:sensor histidine kinase [Frondihabitans australicus]|uniref:histidine kinase n=1 Tax=Frondihabitans australicus TaxID=386892 RepID=A0A495IJA2_9MICO|nr:HAMP domain-containing sensor histidine kinase [Frondihabitans australicus]RKR75371.1 signal transduction histidine kinase [Frondihabitans australicus]